MPKKNTEELVESPINWYNSGITGITGITLLGDKFVENIEGVFKEEDEETVKVEAEDNQKGELSQADVSFSDIRPFSPVNGLFQDPVNLAKQLIPNQYLETSAKNSEFIKELTPTKAEVQAYSKHNIEIHLAKLGLHSGAVEESQDEPTLVSSFLSKRERLGEALSGEPRKKRPRQGI